MNSLSKSLPLTSRFIRSGAPYGGFWACNHDESYCSYGVNSAVPAKTVGSQMSVAAALWLGRAPAGRFEKYGILKNLTAELTTGRGLTFGFVGVQYLFEALIRANRTDAALACLLRTPFPGFGHELYNTYEPATTLWESWTGDSMRQWLAESSRNHHYQVHIHTILRKYFAGLQMPRGGSAWDVVKARPEAALLHRSAHPALSKQLPAAAVSLYSHRGRVAVSWRRSEAGRVQLNVTVPSSSTGEVHMPLAAGPDATVISLLSGEASVVVWAGGRAQPSALAELKARGVVVEAARVEGDFVVFGTGGGTFAFEAG